MTGETRFYDDYDVFTTICIVTICLIWGVYFLNVKSHFERWYVPQYQMISLNMILILCVFATTCAMGFLFPDTLLLQQVIKNLCKAILMTLQASRIFLFFGFKHSRDVQIDRAAKLLEGHPPINILRCFPPVVTLGWIWFGRKIPADIHLLRNIRWRTYIYMVGVVILAYCIAMFDQYDVDAQTWLVLAEGVLMMAGVSGLVVADEVLGKLISPQKKLNWNINMLMFIILMLPIDFLQTFIGEIVDKGWWDEYGNFIMVLEMFPFICVWHYVGVPPKNNKVPAKFQELETLEDWIEADVLRSYKMWESQQMTQSPEINLQTMVDIEIQSESPLELGSALPGN